MRKPGMMALVSMGLATGYAYTVYSVLTGLKTRYFEAIGTLTVIMLFGH